MVLVVCCMTLAVSVVLPAEPMLPMVPDTSAPTEWVSLLASGPKAPASGWHGDTQGRRGTDPVCPTNTVRVPRRRRA
jgi:hypothetical protein